MLVADYLCMLSMFGLLPEGGYFLVRFDVVLYLQYVRACICVI